jgi:hypothetical protein
LSWAYEDTRDKWLEGIQNRKEREDRRKKQEGERREEAKMKEQAQQNKAPYGNRKGQYYRRQHHVQVPNGVGTTTPQDAAYLGKESMSR